MRVTQTTHYFLLAPSCPAATTPINRIPLDDCSRPLLSISYVYTAIALEGGESGGKRRYPLGFLLSPLCTAHTHTRTPTEVTSRITAVRVFRQTAAMTNLLTTRAFVRSAPLNECRSRSNSVRGDLQSGFGDDDDLGIVLFPLSRRRRRSFCHEEERQDDDDEGGLQLRIDKEKTI